MGELMKFLKIAILTAALISTVACNHGAGSYSILEDGQTLYQNTSNQNTKIDVMWVIDSSGSMATSQSNLAANFNSFISNFSAGGYDFQMAVVNTDAYLANPIWTPYYNSNPRPVYYMGQAQDMVAKFRDGQYGGAHSGFFVLTPSTPKLEEKFIINAVQGTSGHGDERAFESMQEALISPHNQGFFRGAGSFLAVIILTDEDDFSSGTTKRYETYDKPLTPVSSFVSFLDTHTNSQPNARRYSVNTISVKDQACLNSIYNGVQKIGHRVMELADATNGIKGNLCGNFATELDIISKEIVKLSTQFYLGNSEPIPETIKVRINGVPVPHVNSNPLGDGGFSYNAEANSIVFHGQAYTPPQGAAINVTFDPVRVQF